MRLPFVKKARSAISLITAYAICCCDSVWAQSRIEILHSFEFPVTAARSPTARLIEGSDGFLYGTTESGGAFGHGTLFKVRKNGTEFQVLHSFGGDAKQDGAWPRGGVIEGSDRFLYGTTRGSFGGSGLGTIFKIARDGTGYVNLRRLQFEDGLHPFASVIEASDGNLYGTAPDGSTQGGSIFRLNRDGTGYTNIWRGAHPTTELIEGPDGMLYGTGGDREPFDPDNFGYIFRINKDGSGFSMLQSFVNQQGPRGLPFLTVGANGSLYGTTMSGGYPTNRCGTIFKLNRDGTGFQFLYTFPDTSEMCNPVGGLIQAPDGALYGTMFSGSNHAAGAVFKIRTDGTGLQSLRNFDYAKYEPNSTYARLLLASDGALYGLSWAGGKFSWGTMFSIGTDGRNFTMAYQFSNGDGRWPYSGVVEGSDGFLYGTTQVAGPQGDGTVFRVAKNGTGYETIYNFPSINGRSNIAHVIQGSDGYLYGTVHGYESILFRIANTGSDFARLQNLPSGQRAPLFQSSDGLLYGVSGGWSEWQRDAYAFRAGAGGTFYEPCWTRPFNAIAFIEGNDGRLYGVTRTGGSGTNCFSAFARLGNCGTIFSINKDWTDFTILHHFGINEPVNNPAAPLLQASDALLYGTAFNAVFRIQKDGNGYTNWLQGADVFSYGPLVEWADGRLYGVSVSGSVFSLNKDGTGYLVITHFPTNYTSGRFSGLTIGSDGWLYGTTPDGGGSGFGTVYRLDVKPRVASIAVSTNLNVQFKVDGLSGQKVTIQASTNLTGWTNFFSGILSNGQLSVNETGAPNRRTRFYRARVER